MGDGMTAKRRTEMSVYVAEINGRGIAAFSAKNRESAEEWAQGGPFQEDLTVLENEGTPLWNGTDEIFVREAYPEEKARFDASCAQAVHDEEAEDENDWLMFLIPVTDPTDGEFELEEFKDSGGKPS
jgi:hypothetical protein